jgi:hypothetical protein
VAENLKAVYLRIDTIEQAIKDASKIGSEPITIIVEGCMTAYAIAKDNLEIGLAVITVNTIIIKITCS